MYIFMVIHGYLCLFLVILVIYGYLCLFLVILGYSWLFLVILGYLWLFLVILGYSWLFLEITRNAIESEFLASEMGSGSHFIKKIRTNSFVLI